MTDPESINLQEKLPPRIARLEDLAYNFWWSWHRASRDLFKRLARTLWTTTRHNPVRILREISPERLVELSKDPIFLRDYDAVLMHMDRDIQNGDSWYTQAYSELHHHPITYFSA